MPLLVKVLLLLAVSLRLLKSQKNAKKIKLKFDYYDLDATSSINPIQISALNLEKNDSESLKYIYRNYIRNATSDFHKLSKPDKMIVCFYFFEKQYRKGKLGRFLWYEMHWVFAFYQLLDELGLEKEKELYEKALYSYSNNSISTILLAKNQWESANFYPTLDVLPTEFNVFNLTFSLTNLAEKLLVYFQKNQENL